MNAPEEKFGEFLRTKGLKFTSERQVILQEIFELHEHFGIEVLYDRLKKRGERISLATIYRLIPLLIESGMIKQAVRCQGQVTYEHVFGHEHHDHLICVKCGKIIEFKDDDIERLQHKICRKFDFEPLEHRLGIRGVCSECRIK